VSSYELGQVFVVAPRNTSKEKIFHYVRNWVQERTGRPTLGLANYSYLTETEWRKKYYNNYDFQWLVDSGKIPVLKYEDYKESA
jgi:hypothetical protein